MDPTTTASGVAPPADTNNLDTLLAHAPVSIEDIPAWIGSLRGRQVNQCWVALVIDLCFDDDGNFTTSRRALAAALAAVRDHARGDSAGVEIPASGVSGPDKWRLALRESLPLIGSEKRLKRAVQASAPTIKRIRLAASGWPEFEISRPKSGRGPAPYVIRRVAV